MQGDEGDELVFVTSDAQLLRFAAAVGAAAGLPGGRHGRHQPRLRGAHVVYFTSVPADAAGDTVVVTIAASSETLLGTDPGSAKVVALRRVPGQGTRDRRRAGARVPEGRGRAAPRVGRPLPRARGRAPTGRRGSCPTADAKRDASGQPLEAVVAAVGFRIG